MIYVSEKDLLTLGIKPELLPTLAVLKKKGLGSVYSVEKKDILLATDVQVYSILSRYHLKVKDGTITIKKNGYSDAPYMLSFKDGNWAMAIKEELDAVNGRSTLGQDNTPRSTFEVYRPIH